MLDQHLLKLYEGNDFGCNVYFLEIGGINFYI